MRRQPVSELLPVEGDPPFQHAVEIAYVACMDHMELFRYSTAGRDNSGLGSLIGAPGQRNETAP